MKELLRTFLILLALVPAMLVFAGCGGAGNGNSSQASGEEEQRASRSAEDSGGGQASKE